MNDMLRFMIRFVGIIAFAAVESFAIYMAVTKISVEFGVTLAFGFIVALIMIVNPKEDNE